MILVDTHLEREHISEVFTFDRKHSSIFGPSFAPYLTLLP
jgi:hypothetical protein